MKSVGYMFYAGIDVGSRTTKAVILNQNREIVSREISETGTDGPKAAEQVLNSCLEKGGIGKEELVKVVSTGYGKKRVASASMHLTEITCHARGASLLLPGTRTVIDIGGQDSKVILLSESGDVIDFAMNDRCAAGTGRFLEFMARALEMDLFQMAAVPHNPARAKTINNLCTVFAESEVVSFLAEGYPVEDIVRGLHASVAERTAALLKRVPFAPPITMTGGVAKNRGVVDALQELLNFTLNIPEEPQVVGAVGAACAAHGKAETRESGSFSG